MAQALFWTAGSLVLIISTFSILASITTIHIMHKMNVWNGYVLLVYAVAVAQTFYDVSFYFLIGGSDDTGFCLYRAWNSASGVSVILWINVMSTLVLYTTFYLVSFRVKNYFYPMSVVIVALSLLMGIPDFITCLRDPQDNRTNWIYFGIRLVSIFYNILVYIFITILLRLPYSISLCHWTISDIGLRRKTNDLLVVLVRRLKYYPIVQVISRVFALVWDVKYGFGQGSWTQDGSTLEVAIQILYDITNPCAGIGYFLVFLWVQPSAYACFQEMMHRWRHGRCCTRDPAGGGHTGHPSSTSSPSTTTVDNPLTSTDRTASQPYDSSFLTSHPSHIPEFTTSSVDHPMVLPHQPAHPQFPRFNSWVSAPNLSVDHHPSRLPTRSTTTTTAGAAVGLANRPLVDDYRWDLDEDALFEEIQRRTTIDDQRATTTSIVGPASTRPSATATRGTMDFEAQMDADENL